MGKWLKKFWDWANPWIARCPNCKEYMDSELDPKLDKLVYTCRDCKKQWI